MVDEQLTVLNRTVEDGVNIVDGHLTDLNRTAEDGVNVVDDQFTNLNENIENATDLANQQAAELNMTAEAAKDEMARAVDSLESTSDVIENAIELWKPSVKIFLDILGPIQMIAGANYFVLILKNLGLTPNVPDSIKQLDVTNDILRDMTDTYQEFESLKVVHEITRSSVVLEESAEKLTSHFFFSQSNLLVRQLRGNGNNYFAYDSLSDLFGAVYCWNAFLHAAASENPPDDHDRRENLKKFGKRQTIIHFLPPLSKHMTLPLVEFPEIFKEIYLINHWKARDRLMLKSVKIDRGCFVQLEYLTVLEIDATSAGKSQLRKCAVGWDPRQYDEKVVCKECTKTKQ